MPLSQIEVIQEGLDGMHAMLDRAVPDMTTEQWNARPAGDGVSAFFSLWHYVRTEDNIVNWVVASPTRPSGSTASGTNTSACIAHRRAPA